MATLEELYGPQRTLARDRAKRLLETDHVTCNFQRGIERQSGHRAFQTETAHSFRVSIYTHVRFSAQYIDPSPCGTILHLMQSQEHVAADLVSSLRERASRDPVSQNATHLNLGSDTSPRTTVVRSDFTAKPTPRVRDLF